VCERVRVRVLRKSAKSHSRVRPNLVRTLHSRSTRSLAKLSPPKKAGFVVIVIFVSRPSPLPPMRSNLKEAATGTVASAFGNQECSFAFNLLLHEPLRSDLMPF